MDAGGGMNEGGADMPWPFPAEAGLHPLLDGNPFQQILGGAVMGGAPGIMAIRRTGGGGGGARPQLRRGRSAGTPSANGGSGPPEEDGGGGGGQAADEGAEQMFLNDHFLRSLISNLTGVPIAGGPGGGGGGHFHFTVGPLGGGGGNVMYGNPGDYVWGRGGFDAIVTQLLNQMEGSGPPPMTKDTIDKDVPTIKVTQQHVGKKKLDSRVVFAQ